MLKIQNHDHYLFKETFDTEQNVRIIYVESNEKPLCCPWCDSEAFNKKTPEKRTVLDIYQDMPAKIIITKQRYYCPHCRHSFAADDLYPAGLKYTKDFEDFVAQTMVNENLSLAEMSQKYGVSRAYVSGALTDYRKQFQKSDVQIQACTTLYFHKFQYKKNFCCCVCGADQDNPKALKLLGIYESYSKETVKTFVKKLSSVSDVRLVYHDLVLDMTEALNTYFGNAIILANRKHFIKTAWDIVDQSKPENLQANIEFYRETKNQLDPPKQNAATAILNAFYRSSAIVQLAFDKLIAPIKLHKEVVSFIYKFKNYEIDIEPITKIIEKLRKKNTHFDLLVIRMMILSKAVRKELKKSDLGRYLSRDPESMFDIFTFDSMEPKLTYYVDVNDLEKEIG